MEHGGSFGHNQMRAANDAHFSEALYWMTVIPVLPICKFPVFTTLIKYLVLLLSGCVYFHYCYRPVPRILVIFGWFGYK